MHTHIHAEPTQSLKSHTVAWKQKHREMWKRELRGNGEDGGCLSLATGAINCTCVNCLPMKLVDACYICYLCLNSLLKARILREGERQTCERMITLLLFESMNFHLYLFHLLSRSGSGEQWGGCLYIFRNGSLIHRQYKELRLQHPWLMRKTISWLNSKRECK